MTNWLRAQGEVVNRKRVRRLMRIMGLESLAPKPRLSAADRAHPVYPYCAVVSFPMPVIENPPMAPVVLHNELAHLQLEIARRADQLARLIIPDPAMDLALWLQAEQEIFARHGYAPANVTDV